MKRLSSNDFCSAGPDCNQPGSSSRHLSFRWTSPEISQLNYSYVFPSIRPEQGLTQVRFHEVTCCACGSSDRQLFCITRDRLHGVTGEFSYVSCRDCGLIYQHPQVIPEDIPLLYPESYAPWAGGVPRHGVPPPWKRRIRDRMVITGLPQQVQTRLDAGGSLLDVGCGNGRFMARIASEHPMARVEGLDFSPQAATAVRESLGLHVHLGTVQQLAATLPPFDVITMWWYLEHEPDPAAVLTACAGLLKPGGILAIGVPNARSISRALFRDRWFHLDPPRHLWIFTPATMRRLLQGAGLTTVAIRHDYSPWGILGSLQYVIQDRIEDVDRSWLSSRPLKLLTRPVAMGAGLLGLGDTIAVYAGRED